MWHHLWLWVYFNSQTIQAVSAVIGLLILVRYAVDTNKIQKATLAQSVASRRPFFTFELQDGGEYFLTSLIATNVGAGPALDVSFLTGEKTLLADNDPRSAVAVGDTVHLELGNEDYAKIRLQSSRGITLTYTDIAGKKFWTTWDWARRVDGSPIANLFTLKTGDA